MDNQNALTSTAMLAVIWEAENKDTLDLMQSFIIYSIGETTSIGEPIDTDEVSKNISENFGFRTIPSHVIVKSCRRLTKGGILRKDNHKYYLNKDVSKKKREVEAQRTEISRQIDMVIESLTNYLNLNRNSLLSKNLEKNEVKEYFVQFLDDNGYSVYSRGFEKISNILIGKDTISYINYHISQFIIKEHNENTVIFGYIDGMSKGLFLSKVIYGYTDVQSDTGFSNLHIYLDTGLLLRILHYKSEEEYNSAKQMMEIFRENRIKVKCFEHTYTEVSNILISYKSNIPYPEKRYGKTLERFDDEKFTVGRVEMEIGILGDRIEALGIEIVDVPSLSSVDSGIVTNEDFSKVMDEAGLKSHLMGNMGYRNNEALDNDVSSITAINVLRKGKKVERLNRCNSVFVTTNYRLVKKVSDFIGGENAVPLLIGDLDLTTILWLKNTKRFSDFPTIKLLEVAQISIAPTEDIRKNFIKRVDSMKEEGAINEETAFTYRNLVYNSREGIMKLIGADPGNIKDVTVDSLEELSKKHYGGSIYEENMKLKREIESEKKAKRVLEERILKLEKRLDSTSKDRIELAGTVTETIIKWLVYLAFLALLVIGVYALAVVNGRSYYGIVCILIGFIGLVDSLSSRLRLMHRLAKILGNKSRVYMTKREHNKRIE